MILLTSSVPNEPNLQAAFVSYIHERYHVGDTMEHVFVERQFNRIGARVRLSKINGPRRPSGSLVTLDVRKDPKGEFFDISSLPDAKVAVEVIDVQPNDRHLLVLVRENNQKHKYLCGHDERHWFVAAIPETAAVGTVRQAKEALKPREVLREQGRLRLAAKARNRRKNAAYVRQGEWFFVPVSFMQVDRKMVLTNEPISRGNGSKPHWAEFCFRTGGETVYVCSRYPNGVSGITYKQIISRQASAGSWGWRTMIRNASVFVQGRISHADHRTVVLHGWHQVLMNTENQSQAMQNVAFLD